MISNFAMSTGITNIFGVWVILQAEKGMVRLYGSNCRLRFQSEFGVLEKAV